MKPSYSNAFRQPDSSQRRKRGAKRLSAPTLNSMTAVLCETDFGWSLKLSPMRAFDALRILSSMTTAQDVCLLLYDVKLADVAVDGRSASRLPRESAKGQTIADLAESLGISVIEKFSGDQLVLDDLSLRELVGMTSTRHMKCVLVEGPIEQRDAEAIVRASARGENPLAAEFRAIAAMTVDHDCDIILDTRTRKQAVQLVSENFRHYLAAIRDQPFDEFGSPESWQLERLLEVSGSLVVRPIETDVYSNSIDVGISTAVAGGDDEAPEIGPADKSLIYDLPSRTWHDEQ
jgi:hypothetical protein